MALVLAASALLASLTVAACARPGTSEAIQAERLATPSRWGTPSVFTTGAPVGRRRLQRVLRPARHPAAAVPVHHQIHLEKELVCTDCHEGVEGPARRLPSVKTCMICHARSRPTGR